MGRALGRAGDGGVDGVDPGGRTRPRRHLRSGQAILAGQFACRCARCAISSAAWKAIAPIKGVFVTTSYFPPTAYEFVTRVSKRVALIDGRGLADLMIRHRVGVRVKQTLRCQPDRRGLFRGVAAGPRARPRWPSPPLRLYRRLASGSRHVRQCPHRQSRRDRLPHHRHGAAVGNADPGSGDAGRPRRLVHPPRRRMRTRSASARKAISTPRRSSRWRAGSARNALHPGYGFLSENADFAEAARAPASSSSGRRPRRCARWASRARPRR